MTDAVTFRYGLARMAVTMSLRLAYAPKPASIVSMRRYFAVRPQFWLGLQRDYDLMTFDTSQLGPIVPLTAGRPLTQA